MRRKTVVVSFQKIGSGSYEMASLKIAKFVATETVARIVDTPETSIDELSSSDPIGRLFVVSGMWQFCKHRDFVVELCRKAERDGASIYFCCNDYKTPLPGEIRKTVDKVIQICNGDYGSGKTMLNWNALTFYKDGSGWINKPTHDRVMVYYGAYRDGRKESFDRFLSGKRFVTAVSTSQRNFADFTKHGRLIYDEDKSIESLAGKYGFTVYMSDQINHEKMFVFPANRFYECLSYGLFQFIDRKTMLSFRGFPTGNLEPFVVENDLQVYEKLNKIDFLRMAQKRLLFDAKDYQAHLRKQFHAIVAQ